MCVFTLNPNVLAQTKQPINHSLRKNYQHLLFHQSQYEMNIFVPTYTKQEKLIKISK